MINKSVIQLHCSEEWMSVEPQYHHKSRPKESTAGCPGPSIFKHVLLDIETKRRKNIAGRPNEFVWISVCVYGGGGKGGGGTWPDLLFFILRGCRIWNLKFGLRSITPPPLAECAIFYFFFEWGGATTPSVPLPISPCIQWRWKLNNFEGEWSGKKKLGLRGLCPLKLIGFDPFVYWLWSILLLLILFFPFVVFSIIFLPSRNWGGGLPVPVSVLGYMI